MKHNLFEIVCERDVVIKDFEDSHAYIAGYTHVVLVTVALACLDKLKDACYIVIFSIFKDCWPQKVDAGLFYLRVV